MTAPLVGTSLAGIRGVRLLDGSIADLRFDADRVGELASPSASERVLDGDGWLLVPGPVEPHAHLDKALTADRVRPGAGLDLVGAVESWRELSASIDAADVHARALAAIGRYVERGFTAIRTHVNLGDDAGVLAPVQVMVELREALRDHITLQVCLLPGQLADDALIRDAVALGVDVLGGCPHLALDPHHETTRLLDIAEDTGLPVDLHTDEQTDASEVDIVDLAQQVLARGLQQKVTASHSVRLGSLPPQELAPALDLLARAGIGVVGLPITNLYLQGWDATHLMPRGITAARALLDAGIDFAAGGDNLRDPFNPVGRADPFETTSLLVVGAHLRPEEALAAVTTGARAVTGLPVAGAVAGAEASFVLVPDVAVGDVIAGATDARVVVHRGRLVSRTDVTRTLSFAARTAPRSTPALTPMLGR